MKRVFFVIFFVALGGLTYLAVSGKSEPLIKKYLPPKVSQLLTQNVFKLIKEKTTGKNPFKKQDTSKSGVPIEPFVVEGDKDFDQPDEPVIYAWVDENGVKHYQDRKPTQAVGKLRILKATPVKEDTHSKSESGAPPTQPKFSRQTTVKPDINESIIDFVNKAMGRTIGRGECWDLAQVALDEHGAQWKRPFAFGKVLNPNLDRVLPGDIIQFKSVRIETDSYWKEIGAPDHTAIVTKVLGPKFYEVAHQNVNKVKKVVLGEIDLNHVVRGEYTIYRPLKG